MFALQDAVRKAWFPIAAWVQVMEDKAVVAFDRLERRGLPIKLHFWKCLEGLIPQQCVTANDYKEGKATEGCTSVGTSSLPPGQRLG